MPSGRDRLGPWLKAQRMQRGLSLYGLAKASGVDRAAILRLERGEHEQPRPETLTRLADALGVNPADLYAAAGYTAKRALPSFRPYLRTKYGHLPASQRNQLSAYFDRLSAEYETASRTRPARSPIKPKPTKGGRR